MKSVSILLIALVILYCSCKGLPKDLVGKIKQTANKLPKTTKKSSVGSADSLEGCLVYPKCDGDKTDDDDVDEEDDEDIVEDIASEFTTFIKEAVPDNADDATITKISKTLGEKVLDRVKLVSNFGKIEKEASTIAASVIKSKGLIKRSVRKDSFSDVKEDLEKASKEAIEKFNKEKKKDFLKEIKGEFGKFFKKGIPLEEKKT